MKEFFGIYHRLRWLAGPVIVLLMLGIGALVWRQVQPATVSTRVGVVVPSAPVQPTAAPTTVAQPGGALPPTSPEAVSPPAPVPTAASTPTPPVPYPEAEVAAAQDVATKFLVALESYRYDDPADALTKAARPYVTDKLDQELSKSSGGAAANAKRVASHEITSAAVLQIGCEGCAGGAPLGFVGQVKQHIHSDAGDRDETVQVETIMTKTPAGWRVAEVNF